VSESVCDKNVARFVSCDLWNDKHAVVDKAIATIVHESWNIHNAMQCQHGTIVAGVQIRLDKVQGRWE
jgi:hypothetical protein